LADFEVSDSGRWLLALAGLFFSKVLLYYFYLSLFADAQAMQSSSEEFTLIPAQNKQISMSR
jgi:hypothetical protein